MLCTVHNQPKTQIEKMSKTEFLLHFFIKLDIFINKLGKDLLNFNLD